MMSDVLTEMCVLGGCAAHRAITDECKHCGNYRAEIERRRMLPLPEKGEHHEPVTIERFAEALSIPVSRLLGLPYGEGVRLVRYPCNIYTGDSNEPALKGEIISAHRCPICRSKVNGFRDNFCWNCDVKFIRKERDT